MATNTLPGRTTPTLTGNGTDDYLFGSSDNDIISGGTGVGTGTDGSDTMEGGAGDDVYIVNDTTDVVIETAGEGDDTVYTAVSYTLPDNVENIGSTKKGTTGIVLTGNAMDNTLDGSQSSNPDTLQGLAGNDTYFLGNDTSASALTNDVVFEGQWATPTTVAGTAIATTSPATGAAMLWTDTAGTDTVSATNTIDLSQSVVKVSSASTVAVTGSGSTAAIVPSATIAANILAASDAAYTVATTLVTPTSFGIGTIVNGTAITVATLEPVGAVVVTSPTAGFTLAQLNAISPVVRGASAIENVFLTGGSVAAGGTSTATGPNITGNALNNRLIGDTDQNVILGGAGNDTLDGGNDLSADTLTGSKGDDTYIVRVSTEGTGSSIDLVTELANEGTDTVRSYATYTLPNNVENLILMAAKNASGTALNGTGNALANSITGNGDGNILTGGAGVDILNGGSGADTLVGGTENDTYIVDNTGDVVTERANEGTDLVQSSVNYTLPTNVENLTLTGTGLITGAAAGPGATSVTALIANIMTGNDSNNTLSGFAGADSLVGGGGADKLDGGTGNDTLDGGTGADNLVGGYGADVYTVDNSGDTVTEVNNSTSGIATQVTASNNAASAIAAGGTAVGLNLINAGLATATTGLTATNSAVSSISLTGAPAALTAAVTAATAAVTAAGTAVTTANGLANTATTSIATEATAATTYATTPNATNLTAHNTAATTASADENSAATAINSALTTATNAQTLVATAVTAATGTSIAGLVTALANLQTAITAVVGANATSGLNAVSTNSATALSSLSILQAAVAAAAVNVAGTTGTTETDLVNSSVNFILPTNVENLTLAGTAAINGTGNSGNNVITGNAGANILDAGGSGNDNLVGNAGNDTITGGSGADTLNGGAGDDQLTGGAGNDTYIVDSLVDKIVESGTIGAGGTDTVSSSITYTLSDQSALNGSVLQGFIENLTLTGAAITGEGNPLANVILGTASNNQLFGLAGADTLDGGTGADTMVGGSGSDFYVVDNVSDTVNESSTLTSQFGTTTALGGNTTGGTDTVQLGVTYDFSTYTGNYGSGVNANGGATAGTTGFGTSGNAGIENIELAGTAGIGATGTIADNTITGNTGANTINGFDGNDTLNGGAGNDSLSGGDGSDVLNESADVTGVIYVTAGVAAAGVTVTSGGNDTLLGNSGNDTINAGAGNDIITGGTGADAVSVGTGLNVIKFAVGSTDTGPTSTTVDALDTVPAVAPAVGAAVSGGGVASGTPVAGTGTAVAGIDKYTDLTLNGAAADKISISDGSATGTVKVAYVGNTVSGSVSVATFAHDMDALLSVGNGNGFNTNSATSEITAAVVTVTAGDLSGKSFLAIDLQGDDHFDLSSGAFASNDFVIEITGSTVTSLTTTTFI